MRFPCHGIHPENSSSAANGEGDNTGRRDTFSFPVG